MDTEVIGGIPNAAWDVVESEFEHAGLRLHYLDASRMDRAPSAEPAALVMLHGMTSHGDSWRPIVARLTHVDRVICPDFRGHGFSDWTKDGYWLADYARDVVTLIDRLGLVHVDLVGHSLGARVSMVLAPMLGDRLRSLVLSDTGPEVSRTAAQQAITINSSAKAVSGFRNDEKLREFLRAEQPAWVEEAIDVRARRLYRRNWADMIVNRGDPDVTWILGRAGLVEVEAMWNGLRSTTAPTLILKARKSFLLDDEIAQRMTEALQHSAMATFECTHFIPYEDPDRFAAVLDAFLADPDGYVASAVTAQPTK